MVTSHYLNESFAHVFCAGYEETAHWDSERAVPPEQGLVCCETVSNLGIFFFVFSGS